LSASTWDSASAHLSDIRCHSAVKEIFRNKEDRNLWVLYFSCEVDLMVLEHVTVCYTAGNELS